MNAFIREAVSTGYPRDRDIHEAKQWNAEYNRNTGALIRYRQFGSVQRLSPLGRSGYFNFRVRDSEFELTGGLLAIEEELIEMFNGIIERVRILRRLLPSSRVQMVIIDNSSAVAARHTVSTPFMRVDEFDGQVVFDLIEGMLQSNEEFDLGLARIVVKFSLGAVGGGYPKQVFLEPMDFAKRKRSIIPILHNENNDCFFECLALGLAQHSNHAKYKQMLRNKNFRAFEAHKLRQAVGAHQSGEKVPLNELGLYAEHFDCNLIVVQYENMSILQKHYSDERRCNIFMLYVVMEEHFHYVRSDCPGAIWDRARFCFKCMSGYQNNVHRCIEKCRRCMSTECEGGQTSLNSFQHHCTACNLKYYDEACFARHMKTICKNEKKCETCQLIYRVVKKEPHKCGFRKCYNCLEYIPINDQHQCYNNPLSEVKEKETDRYIFYDYECAFDEDRQHIPVGIVACYMDGEMKTFKDNDSFITWLFDKQHMGYTAIAHNGGRYDTHFVKAEMIRRGIQSCDVITGNTILYMLVKKLKMRFVDSYRFIPMGLRNFPKTFSITERVKGYFPYRFMTLERLDYIGQMPSIEWFDFDKLDKAAQPEAYKWHEEHAEDWVNLRELCLNYCMSDVELLRQGCMKFRDLFRSITDNEVDPFQYLTIASTCMLIYRRFYMPQNSIAILNAEAVAQNASLKKWQRWADADTRWTRQGDRWAVKGDRAMLFNICVDYGCTRCFGPHTVHPTTFQKMYMLRQRSRDEVQELKGAGYTSVDVIWECEFQETLDSIVLDERERPLIIRDAFFGGHTEPIKLYWKCSPGEKIRYIDYTSLYPAVQLGKLRGITPETYDTIRQLEYPIGHPVSITTDFKPLSEYFGFCKCKVTPPQDLYLPLLPERRSGKLIFDNRTKIGTWTTAELMKAVELGYVIDEVYEVLHFERRTPDLFRQYVEVFLKIKQEAAGWAKLGCSTDEEKDAYIVDYALNQGITLDKEKISDYNPGLYFIAKLCLNSLWGKFGQRDSFTETIDTFDEETFEKYAHNDALLINEVMMHSNIARTLTFSRREELRKRAKNTNIAIAAYTTSYARLRLYEVLEQLNHSVLYMDTDSCIYVDKGESNVKLGSYLGDLTNELDSDEWIDEFVSCGPKSYAYTTNKGKQYVKIKGFTLRGPTAETMSFENLKNMVVNEHETATLSAYPLTFLIGKDHTISTKEWLAGKQFRFTFDKRDILWNDSYIDTVPFINNKTST